MPPKRLPATYAKDAAEFGRQVRERREARGWSQDELVKKAKHAITKETLQRVEKGLASRDTKSLANPQLATLLALASVLESPIVIDMNRPAGFVIEFVDDVDDVDDVADGSTDD